MGVIAEDANALRDKPVTLEPGLLLHAFSKAVPEALV